jgi:two-component system phosphate regulon sensor histidine kinase PhoR
MGADMLAMLSGPAQSNHSIEMSVEPDRVVQVRVTHRSTGGAVFVMYDITELKHLELMRSDFVANVSHELRTPVSVIRANAETLLDGALDDKEVAHEFVAAIHRNSERITNLVSDLLDLARLEAGSVSLVLTEIDMSKVVARTIGGVRTIADGQDITIHNALADAIVCLGDEDAVEQVLTNLIENAIKYGHANGNVWVRSYQTPGRIRIEVIDDGAGIEAIHRTRLFERFYRVDKGRSRASGGTGLGLSIVKHLITSMNGEVGMEPNRPTGSVFWLTLPASQTDPSFVAPA